MGVVFACAPAMRQLYGYYHRTGTLLPGKERQRPNEDFQRMRRKINIRDIFWYRHAILKDGRVRDAHPIFQRHASSDTESPAAPQRLPSDTPQEAQKSVTDWWEETIKKVFSRSSHDDSVSNKPKSKKPSLFKRFSMPHRPPSPDHNADASDQDPLKSPGQDPTLSHQERSRIAGRYKSWGILPGSKKQDDHGHSSRGAFLFEDSAGGSNAFDTRGGNESQFEPSLTNIPSDSERSDPFRSDMSSSRDEVRSTTTSKTDADAKVAGQQRKP